MALYSRSLFAKWFRSRHFAPVVILFVLCALWWNRVLVGDNVLLPGTMLRGFAPFGDDAQAPWNILQWDGMAQYFPWRAFAARELQSGEIPLWNPHQFAGTPFVANGQSAVFYPLNFPFWTMDVARAFGISAFLHSLLATVPTYFLAQHWNRSRAASLLAAVIFGMGGYFSFWVTLPTLSNCASWIPLLVLLFERATIQRATLQRAKSSRARPILAASNTSATRVVWLALALCCALLAGHAQVFFYAVLALLLRAITLPRQHILRALRILAVAFLSALMLGAIQLLPTLELARLGHRAGQSATMSGWEFVQRNALQLWDLPSLLAANWPQLSFNENRGYVGVSAFSLAICGFALSLRKQRATSIKSASSTRSNVAQSDDVRSDNSQNNDVAAERSGLRLAFVLAVFALLFATATWLAQLFYFGVPGLSQMGGVGRALVLWNLGIALGAAFGLDALRRKIKSNLAAPLIIGVVAIELFAANWNTTPSAPRAAIYRQTQTTTFLQNATKNGGRILFLTPRRKNWFATEDYREGETRTHPRGVLPPNGASVYGLNDVNGYDSLSSGAFRQWLIQNEKVDVSPPRNGNIVMLNDLDSPALDALDVRFVISIEELSRGDLREVARGEGCIVYARRVLDVERKSGRDFSPGWIDNIYQPQSFRLGAWFSLLALLAASFVLGARIATVRAAD